MSERHKLTAVEQYGTAYVKQYLATAKADHDAIVSDPLAALAFMCSKAFMRGRRDEVSVVFKERSLTVLQQYQVVQDIDLGRLEAQLVLAKVNNRHDRQMVRELIDFARTDLQAYGCNIFNWAVDVIRTGHAAEAYGMLKGIHAIKDKISSFYLRDVALLEDVEDSITPGDYPYFQPVDTWVERVAMSLNIIEKADRHRTATVRHKIIRGCTTADVSPLLFNAGAWMVGAHAYELLIERL